MNFKSFIKPNSADYTTPVKTGTKILKKRINNSHQPTTTNTNRNQHRNKQQKTSLQTTKDNTN
jgi:hypothetical protein